MAVDFRVAGEGSIYLLEPITSAGAEWLRQYLDHMDERPPVRPSWRFGDSVVIEHRVILDVLNNIRIAGLTVEKG
jgi:hypothetical protein